MGDKFIHPSSTLAETSAPGPWKCLVAGKKVADATAYEGTNDGCGLYYDGADYSDSTTFDGVLNGRMMLCKSDADVAHGISMQVAYFTNLPENGTKYSSITLYLEDSNDDGQCVQEAGGAYYYKYDATAV